MTIQKRMAVLRKVVAEGRESAEHGGGISGLSGIINLLPTSVVTRTARSQAARIDFATSNLRGAPFPLYCAGAKVTKIVCMGPVAGTAANITAMSYDGHFEIGMFIDPKAIEDPADFRDCVEVALADLIKAGTESQAKKPPVKKATTKPAKKTPAKPKSAKTPTKKATKKKAAAKKATPKNATPKTAAAKA
jgi:hypothetical protein